QIELLSHHPDKRERHPIGIRETQIGKALPDGVSPGDGSAIPRLKRLCQPVKSLPANLHASFRRTVGVQEFFLRVVTRFDPIREPAGECRYSCYRWQCRDGFGELSSNV